MELINLKRLERLVADKCICAYWLDLHLNFFRHVKSVFVKTFVRRGSEGRPAIPNFKFKGNTFFFLERFRFDNIFHYVSPGFGYGFVRGRR